MNAILVTIGIFWITVAAYGLTRQRPAEFWRTLTGDAAITRELWALWTIPVRAMRLTFAPTVFICTLALACGWMLLQLIIGFSEDAEFHEKASDEKPSDEYDLGKLYNYRTAKWDNGQQQAGLYWWDV